jgi:hypothetical protein
VPQYSRWRPANLFAFEAQAFHPTFATTFLINFFQYITIEGRTFDSAAGLILNTSPLSRHSGIVRYWRIKSKDVDEVRHCKLRWTHSRIQPWGQPVDYQCRKCKCIQAWDQKSKAESSQNRPVSMQCSYKGGRGQCEECLTFKQPEERYKPLKQPEGVWMAFGVTRSEYL